MTGAQGSSPIVFIALRGGEALELWPDRLDVVHTAQYAVPQIAWAGLVADPATGLTPGTVPGQVIGLRMRDGSAPVFVPADPPDARRLLDALYALRPDLRYPGMGAFTGYMPPPPYGFGYPFGYTGYAAVGNPRVARPGTNDSVLGGIAHLSVFFAPVLLPLILWLACRDTSPYASRQAKQAFFFHLIFSILAVLAVVGFYVVFFTFIVTTVNNTTYDPSNPMSSAFFPFGSFVLLYGVLGVVSLINMILSVVGAVQGFQGKDFHYPLLGWL